MHFLLLARASLFHSFSVVFVSTVKRSGLQDADNSEKHTLHKILTFLGPSWVVLGLSWALLGCFGGLLESEAMRGPSSARLGPSWIGVRVVVLSP